jgi:DNA-binding LytR/AlgR family response regulator
MHCLIVDDDPLICDLLEHFCDKIDDVCTVTKTNSGFESVNLINLHAFDIIFLDYNLPDITGKEILDVISKRTAVIMITSFTDFAAESYNYDIIVDFLVKPIEFTLFYRGIQHAQKFLAGKRSDSERLFIKDGNKLVKIKLEDILYFKAEANYAAVVMPYRKVLTLMTLKELELKLPDFFQRVHRSYIVNGNKIDTIEINLIKIGNSVIPVSQSQEKRLLNTINLLN